MVFVVSITGALFAFEDEIAQLVYHYEKVEVENRDFISIEQIEKCSAPYLKKINAIYYNGKDRSIRVRERTLNDAGERVNNWVYLNPYNGEVLHTKLNGELDFFDIVVQLHINLMLGESGAYAVKFGTLLFLVLILSGIILWWPKNKNVRKQRFRFYWKPTTGWKRKNFDWHVILGFYSSWVLLFAVVTGLAWSFEWMDKTIYAVASQGKPYQEWTETPAKTYRNRPESKGLKDRILHTARADFKAQPYRMRFYYPADSTKSYLVYLSPSKKVFYDEVYYFFDRHTGEMLSKNGPEDKNGGEFIRDMYYDIHVGQIFGLPGRLLMFFTCLICASLPLTGFLIWYGRSYKYKR